MAVGLASSSGWGTIEEPEPTRVPIHLGHRRPIGGSKPTLLGLPLLGNHQHVASLHRVLIEQQQVARSKGRHGQFPIPGQKGIGPRAGAVEVPGSCRQQAPHHKGMPVAWIGETSARASAALVSVVLARRGAGTRRSAANGVSCSGGGITSIALAVKGRSGVDEWAQRQNFRVQGHEASTSRRRLAAL